MKTYYELLEVDPTATLEDIKRNFRREIAKYHPDKVQHLGQEFQEIAASKAAELTQAYKTLSDDARRAEYDESLREGDQGHGPSRSARESAAARPAAPATSHPHARARSGGAAVEPAPHSSVFQQDRAGASDPIFKAAVMRFRQALQSEFGSFEEPRVDPFQIACIPKPPFWKLKLPPRVLGRFVPQVDAAAVGESWAAASRMKKDSQRDLIVFVMGSAVAPAGELAMAIAEQRTKPMAAGGKLTLVPVNTRSWGAHVPNDAPAVVKSLLERLKSA
jgi:curved DNA-binding protein CbpA